MHFPVMATGLHCVQRLPDKYDAQEQAIELCRFLANYVPQQTVCAFTALTGGSAEAILDVVVDHSHGHGRQRGHPKLTADQVRTIRTSSQPHTVLARTMGVSERQIRTIRKGAAWLHV